LAANLALAKDLEGLNLSNCRIGHFGAKAIGECRLPYALKVLDLSNNGIGNDGAWKLAPALDKLTSLESLLLSNNQIGDDGSSEIAHHLPSSLKVLVLRDNDVADVEVKEIALALSKLLTKKLVLANSKQQTTVLEVLGQQP
jgi:Ran GTPase-activating protein (RanGAP) involved in mRNA processing and transport